MRCAFSQEECIGCRRKNGCKIISEFALSRLSCHAWSSDMERAGLMCGQRDDEYPLQAVQRVVSEVERLRDESDRRRGLLIRYIKTHKKHGLCDCRECILHKSIDEELAEEPRR